MPRAQTIRSAVEVASEIFNGANIGSCGMLSVIKTLEFFQHHFFQMGHRDLLVTQNLSQPASTTAPLLTRSVCRSGGYVLTRYRTLGHRDEHRLVTAVWRGTSEGLC